MSEEVYLQLPGRRVAGAVVKRDRSGVTIRWEDGLTVPYEWRHLRNTWKVSEPQEVARRAEPGQVRVVTGTAAASFPNDGRCDVCHSHGRTEPAKWETRKSYGAMDGIKLIRPRPIKLCRECALNPAVDSRELVEFQAKQEAAKAASAEQVSPAASLPRLQAHDAAVEAARAVERLRSALRVLKEECALEQEARSAVGKALDAALEQAKRLAKEAGWSTEQAREAGFLPATEGAV